MRRRSIDRGSALVEAAIVIPCLVLAVAWSVAVTDVLVLKLKGAEALRYALWETTVLKPPPRIAREVRERFADLRSPRSIDERHTGLLLVPDAASLHWAAEIDTTTQNVGIGGASRLSPAAGLGRFMNAVAGTLSGGVDAALERQRFNLHGKAVARVALARTGGGSSSSLLRGGDLPGLRGGRDLSAPASLEALRLQTPLASSRPMELVFDTWKAWPRPPELTLHGGPADPEVSPMRTYPVVEEQVSAQVGMIAFLGLAESGPFEALRRLPARLAQSGFSRAVFGGDLPDVLSSRRMDAAGGGPISILPPEKPDAPWVPSECGGSPCSSHRAGDVRAASPAPVVLREDATMGDGADRTRYTLPFRVHTSYWTESGGTVRDGTQPRLAAPDRALSEDNAYVRSYRCRGHWFAGSRRPQERRRDRRYGPGCP